jgi:WD40 repeat protein
MDAASEFWANPEEKKIAGFCFHPRGKSIVALRPLGEDKVVFYDYEKHAEVPTAEIEIRAVVPELDEKELEGFKKAAGAAGIAFSPDGTLLAFAASNSIVCVYSVADVTTVDGTRKSPVAWTGAKGGKDETKPRPVKPATGVVFIWAGTVAQIVTTNDEGVWVWPDEREKGKKVEGEMHYERFVTRGSSRDSSAGNETSIATPAGGVGLCIAPFGDGSNGVVFRDAKVWTELLGKVVTNDQSPLELPGQTTALACSPDGLLVAAGVGKDGIYIYRQSELIQRIQTGDAVQSLSFRSDGKFLAAILGKEGGSSEKEGGSSEKEGGSSGKAGGSSSKLAFFQLTMHGMAALAKRPIIAEQIAISPNGLWLATVEDKGADGERIRLCSASTGEVIKETPVKISSVAALTVSDAGRVRAFSRNELWDVFGSEEPKPMEIGRTFAVSGDAQWLVRPGKDGALEVMQLPGGESKPAVAVSEKGDPQQQVAQEPAPIRRNVRARAYRSTFAFSHTGKVFAAHKPTAGRIDLCANPWLKPPPQSSYIPCAKPLRAMAFALDDHLLFAATLDGNLLVFDLTMGKQCFVRRANGAVLAMATSLKPPVLGVAMADQPLRLWGGAADQEELKTVAGAYPVELDWNELSDDQKKAQRDKPLEPVDERTAAFWDAFWKTGRAVQQLKETASVAELEAAYAPLRAVLSDEGAPDSSWQMKAMRERLRFWKLLAPSAARSKEDLERLSAALPRLEAMEQEIVKRSGILPGTEAATSPAPGGR